MVWCKVMKSQKSNEIEENKRIKRGREYTERTVPSTKITEYN